MQIQLRMFIKENGAIRGPFPLVKLQEMKVSGRLLPNVEVSVDRVNWQPASSVEVLFPELVQRAAAPVASYAPPVSTPSANQQFAPIQPSKQKTGHGGFSNWGKKWAIPLSIVSLLVLGVAVWLTCFRTHLSDAKDAYAYAHKSVLQVVVWGRNKKTKEPAGSSGTAFCVTKDGLFVTNQHVVPGIPGVNPDFEADLSTLSVIYEGRTYPATLERVSQRADLALIRVPSLRLRPLRIDDNLVPPGSTVYAAGFPGSISAKAEKNPDLNISRGVVNNGDRRGGNGEDSIEHDAKINHGNSGGPLINEEGSVVGVNTWALSAMGENGVNISICSKAIFEEFPDVFGK